MRLINQMAEELYLCPHVEEENVQSGSFLTRLWKVPVVNSEGHNIRCRFDRILSRLINTGQHCPVQHNVIIPHLLRVLGRRWQGGRRNSCSGLVLFFAIFVVLHHRVLALVRVDD